MRDVARHDYEKFFNDEIRYRKELGYPPFTRITLLEFSGTTEEPVRKSAEDAALLLRKSCGQPAVMGPSPAAIPRIRDRFRWHVVIRIQRAGDPSGDFLSGRLGAVDAQRRTGVRMTIDTDPQSLM